MMRKSTVALIIIISGLMFYAGCDDNDGGGGQGAPGADISRICERCPCNFFMDIDVSCWGNPKDVGALFDPGKGGLNTDCALVGASVQLPELDVKTASGESTCNIKLGHPTDLCPSYTDPSPYHPLPNSMRVACACGNMAPSCKSLALTLVTNHP